MFYKIAWSYAQFGKEMCKILIVETNPKMWAREGTGGMAGREERRESGRGKAGRRAAVAPARGSPGAWTKP